MNESSINILLVEDDDVDVRAVKRGFAAHQVENPITVARDGIEALEILRGTGDSPPLGSPYLILLDLNMPRMNGIEFLEVITSDPNLENSIVFILSTSDDQPEIVSAYDKNVAGFLQKSAGGVDFVHLAKMMKHYFRMMQFPEKAKPITR